MGRKRKKEYDKEKREQFEQLKKENNAARIVKSAVKCLALILIGVGVTVVSAKEGYTMVSVLAAGVSVVLAKIGVSDLFDSSYSYYYYHKKK